MLLLPKTAINEYAHSLEGFHREGTISRIAKPDAGTFDGGGRRSTAETFTGPGQ